MVVEGENDARLAIECDGDEFHGPDRWSADMNRQRVLERAGWTFWRCFASTWAMRKDEILDELLQRLAAMGIEPLGTLENIPSLVDSRTWKPTGDIEVTVEFVDQVDALLNVGAKNVKAATQGNLFTNEVPNTAAAVSKAETDEEGLVDERGNIQLPFLKKFTAKRCLMVEDKRDKGGRLWVLSTTALKLKNDADYGELLQDIGFKWSDVKGGWYSH
jgi:hypothetical protein